MYYGNKKHKRVSSLGSLGMVFAFTAAILSYADQQGTISVASLTTAAAAIPYVNPKSRNSGEQRIPVTPNPLHVEIGWGTGLLHDLDLWVRCYSIRDGLVSNALSVGYRRTSDGWLDLQRDDQGGPSPLNKEVVQANSEVSRVPPDTTCWFNVHLYNSWGGALPVKGTMLIVQDKDSDNQKVVADVVFELREPGQEITVVYATWDNFGVLKKEAVETYPKAKLRPIATAPLPPPNALPTEGEQP